MAGSDFSIDFAAAVPQVYDHDTGGGAFEDKTINLDAVESLEGGDFAVGDIISYFFNVVVDANPVDTIPQTIEIDVSFLANTTGQTGVSHRDIIGVSANYYTGEFSVYDDPTSTVLIIDDSGLDDDDSTTAWIAPGTEIFENKVTGEVYADYDTASLEQGAVISATIRLNDLEPGEEVIVRVNTLLGAVPGSTPTGNLQGFVTGARVISATDDPIINIGNQTIPFKLTPDVSGIPELAPGLTVEKAVTTDLSGITVDYANHTTTDVTLDAEDYFDSVKNESVTVLEGSTVRYLYRIENTGNAAISLVNLLDDNGTSADDTDDIYVFYGQDGNNNSETLWNRLANESNNIKNNTDVTTLTAPDYNNGIQVLGSGFLDDTENANVLSELEDLDGNLQGGGNDLNSIDVGNSIYVYYDVIIVDSDRTNLESFTNIATTNGAIDPNGGGNHGDPLSDTDTANVQILPSDAGTASLSGYAYLDLDNDGVKDADELGIAGALITISNGVDTFKIRTDLNGFYLFTDLPDGSYTITQTQPANYYDGKETVGTVNSGGTGGGGTVDNDINNDYDEILNNRISTIDIDAGNYYSDYNFGELLPADIGGVAYLDLNGDGNRQDTETGYSGIDVTITGTNDYGEAVNVTTTTDSSGRYYFGGLRPSDSNGYTITFPTNPGDVSATSPGDVGQILGTDVGTAGTDQITDIILSAGSSGVNYDYGIPTSAVGGTISGTVFQDTGIYNDDGILGNADDDVLTGTKSGTINDNDDESYSTTPATGEKRIAGVTITLYDDSNNVVATTKTDINGNYSFTGLDPGTYSVEETPPQYFDPTANNGEGGFVDYIDGQEAINNVPFESGNDTITGLVIVDSSTNLVENNFAELPPVSLSGYVFLDLLRTNDFGIDENQALTDSDTSTTINDINGDPAEVGNNGSFTVFSVDVRNGEFDDDEFGIAGITLRLTGVNDLGENVDETIITDANGYYRFDEYTNTNGNLVPLRPSDSNGYTITQLQPAASSGYVDGIYNFDADLNLSADEVNAGNILGNSNGTYDDPGYNPNTEEDNFSGIVLNFGESGVDYNFPEATNNGLITGKVYIDANNNGDYDIGETGISGVTITLSNGDTVVTDEDGDYFFSVAAGTYSITQTQPSSYDDGLENTSNVISSVVVTAGESNSDNDFGELLSIDGEVYSEEIDGTTSNEIITGGEGQDTLTGGTGVDVFVFTKTSDGVDIIEDFDDGEDLIDFSAIVTGELSAIDFTGTNPFDAGYVEAVSFGSHTIIQLDFDNSNTLQKDVLLLNGIDASDISADDFIF